MPRSGGLRTKTPVETDPLFEAYRRAKARHDEAIAALKQASSGRSPPDPRLVQAQAAAALEEFEALAALRQATD
jgi:hypothetical protein